MIKELPAVEIGHKQNCLLLGNGINLLFGDSSWETIIKEVLAKAKSPLDYSEIKGMPATMQIVAATNDHVDQQMKALSEKLMEASLSEERKEFLQDILSMPVEDILTANYSFELEVADGMELTQRHFSSKLRSTFELKSRHKRFRLFQYYETKTGKRLWHIHGDAAKPETMIMGHYYYAKQLSDLLDCVAKSVQRYRVCERKQEPFQSYSWIDRFLTADVFILGLGMYLCEADLWYLLCCKARNFPETHVYFYNKDCKEHDIGIMLRAYGVQMISGNDLKAPDSGDESFCQFYALALQDIQKKISLNKERE